MDNRNTRLLREYVRQTLTLKQNLNEYSETGETDPYGRLDFSSDVYYNVAKRNIENIPRLYSGGEDPGPLLKAFVEPFTDVFKTAVAGAKSITAEIGAALQVAFELVISSVIPFVSADYKAIFDRRDERLEKIQDEYQDVFDRTEEAFGGDAKLLGFMINPALFLASSAAVKAPAVTKELLSVATGGISDSVLETAKETWDSIESALLNGKINKKDAERRKQEFYDELVSQLERGSSKRESFMRAKRSHLFEEVPSKKKIKSSTSMEDFLKDILKNQGVVQALSSKIKENERMKKLHSELTKLELETLKQAEESAQKITNQVSTPEGVKQLASKNPKAKKAIEDLKDPKAFKNLSSNIKKATNQIFATTISTRMEMLPKDSDEYEMYQKTLDKVSKL